MIMGISLISIPEKRRLLDLLEVTNEVISRATRLIVRLTPYGLFAIAAVEAGTLARVAAVATDKVLAAAIKTATGGRVADAVLSPLGLNALRQHAGSLVTPERDPAAAVNSVLRAVHARLEGGGKLFATALNQEGLAAA